MELLGTEEIILMIIKVGFGFFASVAAILVWSQTRRVNWVVLVLASLFQYLEVLVELMDLLGVFPAMGFQVMGLSPLRLFFALTVPTLYGVGFLLAFRAFRKYEEE